MLVRHIVIVYLYYAVKLYVKCGANKIIHYLGSPKHTEKIFRSVNITLVNKLKVVYGAIEMDIWEVINAVKTKPFYPGAGRGAEASNYAPSVLVIRASRDHPHWGGTRSVALDFTTIESFYAVLSSIVDANFDYRQFVEWSDPVIDTRNVVESLTAKKDNSGKNSDEVRALGGCCSPAEKENPFNQSCNLSGKSQVRLSKTITSSLHAIDLGNLTEAGNCLRSHDDVQASLSRRYTCATLRGVPIAVGFRPLLVCKMFSTFSLTLFLLRTLPSLYGRPRLSNMSYQGQHKPQSRSLLDWVWGWKQSCIARALSPRIGTPCIAVAVRV